MYTNLENSHDPVPLMSATPLMLVPGHKMLITYIKGNSSASDSQYTRWVIQLQAWVPRHSLSVTAKVKEIKTAVPVPDKSCAKPSEPGVVRVYQGKK